MKRCIAVILVCIMLFGSLPAMANESGVGSRPMLIYTNLSFDDQKTGDTRPNGFTQTRPAAQDADVIEIAAASDANGKEEKFVRLSEGSKYMYTFMYHSLAYAGINKPNQAKSGKSAIFSLKVMTEDTNSQKKIDLFYNANVPHATDFTDRVSTFYTLLDISGSKISALGKPIVESLTTGQWYDIDFAINLTTQSADIYVDGVRKLKGISLPKDTYNISALEFYIPQVLTETAESSWCFDDFKIYEATEPLSDEDFAKEWSKYEGNEFTPSEEYSVGLLFRYDKYAMLTLHNRFVTAVGGTRFYKDNQFYDLPVAIREVEGTYLVPLRAFAESFGASVGFDPSNNGVTLTYGDDTLKGTLGSDIFYINGKLTKSRYPLTSQKGHSCIPMNVLSILFGIDPVRQGDLIILDEKPIQIDWVYDENLKTNRDGLTFEDAVMQQITRSFLYERPLGKDVVDTYKANNPDGTHPRLIIKPGTFEMLRAERQTDTELNDKIVKIISQADKMLELPVVEYVLKDGLRGTFPQQLCDRGITLSFAYKITGDEKYKDKLWENLEAATKFPDFNPGHFLDVGRSGEGVAVAYDWLYDDWNDTQKSAMEKMMYEFVLIPMINSYKTSYVMEDGASWITQASNQNVVMNNAGLGCAIGLIDKYPTEAAQHIANICRSMERPLALFAPDGGWEEGVDYWKYTMISLPYVIESYQNGIGSDFGLMNSPGLDNTAYYPIFMAGTEGVFNFGDDVAGASSYSSSIQWFASEFNDRSLAILRANNTASQGIQDILYHVPNIDKTEEVVLDKAAYFEKLGTATFRTGWSDSDIVAVLHGGDVNGPHGHEDNGAFLLDAFGQRWICDLPKEDYNVSQYGKYTLDGTEDYDWEHFDRFYRYKAEGHNTVVADLYNRMSHTNTEKDRVSDMEFNAFSEIIKFENQEAGGYAILDMTPTNNIYECALRGIKLDRGMQEVIVQDNFRAEKETEFVWSMHTQADVEILPDKKSAILTIGSQRLWVGIISDGDEELQVTSAATMYPEFAPPVETANDTSSVLKDVTKDYRKLLIHKKNTKNFNVTVCFKQLLTGQTKPAAIPEATPMETWYFAPTAEKLPTLSNITVDGETIPGFSENINTYSYKVPTQDSPVPKVSAQTDTDLDVEIIEAQTIPGVTSILLLDDEGNQKAIYNVAFAPVNDTSKFLNKKQIPLADFYASSEPEAQNGVANLFDASLTSKYATDEQGGSVIMDFGELYDVAEVKMAFANGSARKEKFTIEASVNGTDWTMLVADGSGNGVTTGYQDFVFEPVNARYIRVKFYGHEKDNGATGNWVSVSEMCAFQK